MKERDESTEPDQFQMQFEDDVIDGYDNKVTIDNMADMVCDYLDLDY